MTKNYANRGIPVDVGPTLSKTKVKTAADYVVPMGTTSENVAARYVISREMQDEYASRSHGSCMRCQREGKIQSGDRAN